MNNILHKCTFGVQFGTSPNKRINLYNLLRFDSQISGFARRYATIRGAVLAMEFPQAGLASYEFLLNGGVTKSGKTLITSESIEKCTSLSVSGWNGSLKIPLAIGRGFVRSSLLPSTFGWWNSV